MINRHDGLEEKVNKDHDVKEIYLIWPGWRLRLITFLLIPFVIIISIWALSPPKVELSSAPPSEFSADRGSNHLKIIGKAPHPIGSEEHKKVREYIVNAFNELKLETTIQVSTITNERSSYPIVAATTHNIIARLKGSKNSKAIMLVAHYDSVPNSFGVSDDGAGVATLLETARALRSNPSLKNDVIFLVTDGEELGLLGAKAFMKKNPLLNEVGIVFNFEARGSSGPAYMFETSPNNGYLIRNLLPATPRPISSSFMNEIYKFMPNDTDFTLFKQAGINGLNFAFINGSVSYHSASDSMSSIDLRSLQHMGSYALNVTLAADNIDLNNIKEPDNNYFDILHTVLIHYSNKWILPQIILVFLLFIVVTIFGVKRKQIRLVGTAMGMVTPLITILTSIGIALLAAYAIKLMQNWREELYVVDTLSATLYVLGIVAFAVAMNIAIYGYFLKKSDVLNLSIGSMIIWLVLTLLVYVYAPGCSYLLILPLFFNCVGLLILGYRGNDQLTFTLSLLVTICSLPGIFLWTPVLYGIFKAFGIEGSSILAVIVALLFGTITYSLNVIIKGKRWLLTSIFLFAGLSLFIAGKITWSYSTNIPTPNSIFYAKNGDNNSAVWGSFDLAPDDWTKQFFKGGGERRKLVEFFPNYNGSLLVGTAPLIDAAPPEISIVSDTTANNVRTVRLKIISVRQAAVLHISISKETEITSAALNGEPLKIPIASTSQRGFGLQYHSLPENGFELTLETKQNKPISIKIMDQSYGLPKNDKINFVDRPNNMMPSQVTTLIENSTFVNKVYKF